ncbi:MAG: hypothetical protein IPK18_03490 [Sphingobacteriales bacterium]|nr:MAG: hypothetical protein IPK18_03490 [Sphingobacteriales bacterium]
MLIAGKSSDEIVHYSSDSWNIGERQAEKYLHKARALITQSIKKEINYDYAKAIIRYEELYKLSFERKDYKTAMSVIKEITALQGLNKLQIEHAGEINFICSIPD